MTTPFPAPSDWRYRVEMEKAELDARRMRLQEVLSSPEFIHKVGLVQYDLMRRQLSYMNAYSSTLGERLDQE